MSCRADLKLPAQGCVQHHSASAARKTETSSFMLSFSPMTVRSSTIATAITYVKSGRRSEQEIEVHMAAPLTSNGRCVHGCEEQRVCICPTSRAPSLEKSSIGRVLLDVGGISLLGRVLNVLVSLGGVLARLGFITCSFVTAVTGGTGGISL